MAALRAHQEQIIATQTQHTAILRQIQSHLGIPSAPQHQMPAPLEPTEPTPGDTQTSTWVIIFTSSAPIYLIISIVYFMYFLYALSYYSSTYNPMLLLWYILGLVVLLVIIFNVLAWSNTTLSFFAYSWYYFIFIPLLISIFFLKHVVSPYLLKLHTTKEVPLPPYFSIAFVTLKTMFSLVAGRVEEVSIVNNAKLFW